MARRVWPWIAAAAALSALGGCGFPEQAERPAWRTQVENACLAEGRVAVSEFVQPAAAIDGPGICGLAHPFKVTALAGGTVRLNAPQTLDCSMIPALDRWITDVVQPAARASFGQPLVAIRAFGSYECRAVNNNTTGHYSEHAFGNAIDIAAFRLADGREISVLRGWRGDPAEQAFLRSAHGGACGIFTTVLGPGYPQHDNHFHVDLGRHGNTSRGLRSYCQPKPQTPPPVAPKQDDLPEPPALQEDMDVSQAGPGDAGVGFRRGVEVGAPLQLQGYQARVAHAAVPPDRQLTDPLPMSSAPTPRDETPPDGTRVDDDLTSTIKD